MVEEIETKCLGRNVLMLYSCNRKNIYVCLLSIIGVADLKTLLTEKTDLIKTFQLFHNCSFKFERCQHKKLWLHDGHVSIWFRTTFNLAQSWTQYRTFFAWWFFLEKNLMTFRTKMFLYNPSCYHGFKFTHKNLTTKNELR